MSSALPQAPCFDKRGDHFSLSFFDVCLQCSPARKPVIARDVEQSISELGPRVGAAQALKAILGELLQEFERRAFGELSST